MHFEFDMYIRNRVDTSPTPVPWHTMRKHFLIFLSTMLIMFGIGQIYPTYRPVVSDTLGKEEKQQCLLSLLMPRGVVLLKQNSAAGRGWAKKCPVALSNLSWVAWLSSQVLFCSEQFLFTGN